MLRVQSCREARSETPQIGDQADMTTDNGSPVAYAYSLWNRFVAKSNRRTLNTKGQFATPPKVARYMASMIPMNSRTIDLLEAGAGTGILTAAVGERCDEATEVEELNLGLYEIDDTLCNSLRESMSFLKKWLSEKGVVLNAKLIEDDFITQNESFFDLLGKEGIAKLRLDYPYSSAIMNPPYFKINKSDERAKAASKIVHGRPNIYALFLMLAALMLRDSGTLVSISPRSFTSGPYFRRFRKCFFRFMHPVSIHVFSSRTRAFKSAGVLQETIIMRAQKSQRFDETRISSSIGASDLENSSGLVVRTSDICRESDGKVLFLPLTDFDIKVMRTIEGWPESFRSMGLRVSTGPVVPFRATKYLIADPTDKTVCPLLWMQNVRCMNVVWPLKLEKPDKMGGRQYIEDSVGTRKLLRSVSPYVLLHRFSVKEQTRRFTAALLDPEGFPFERIGFENHLNYVHRPGSVLEKAECVGIAAILNSRLLDAYIRTKSGSTQINASDMKSLPLPSRGKILSIGKKFQGKKVVDKKELELVVLKALGLEDYLEVFWPNSTRLPSLHNHIRSEKMPP